MVMMATFCNHVWDSGVCACQCFTFPNLSAYLPINSHPYHWVMCEQKGYMVCKE